MWDRVDVDFEDIPDETPYRIDHTRETFNQADEEDDEEAFAVLRRRNVLPLHGKISRGRRAKENGESKWQ